MAVDGSLIFNTKIDTSGLNSDIARINKAIEAAQKKAQASTKRTGKTAKAQAKQSASVTEQGKKRETSAAKRSAVQTQNSAKETTKVVEQAAKEAESKVEENANKSAQDVQQATAQSTESVKESVDSVSESLSDTTENVGSSIESMAQDVASSGSLIEAGIKIGIKALEKLVQVAKKIAEQIKKAIIAVVKTIVKVVTYTAKTVSQALGTALSTIGKFTLKQFIGDFEKQSSGLSNLLITLGSYFSLYKLFDWGKEGVELGSDLAEVQNVVDVTFSHMTDSVDSWAKSARNAYGLSETMAKKYVGTFGSMAEAFGFTEQQAFNMSTALTALTGDVASFYNITQDEAYTKLKSVFSGETETLKDLGIVMTQNALDNYAMANGWSKTTSEMTEAEKVTLRYNFVLDQLNNATGDFARTQNSWANQTRILQLRWQTLLSTIGKALINIFTPILLVLNEVLDRLQSIAQWFESVVTAVFGNSSASSGALSDGMNDLSDSANSATDNINNTSSAVEKLQNNISAFDELNVMSDTTQDNTDFEGQVNQALITAGILKDIVADTVEPVKDFKFDKILVQSIKSGNWRLVGLVLANKLKKTLQKIKWEDIQEAAVKIANGIADFINGALENKTVWETVGETIAQGLNTAFKFLLTLLSNINWEDLGEAIAEMFNGFLEDFDPVVYGELAAEKINAIFDALHGFASTFDWKQLGSSIAESLLAYFSGLKLTDESEGSKIPDTIAEVINGIVQAGIELFTYTDPDTGENVWSYIGDVLGEGLVRFLDTFSITDAIELVKDAVFAIITMIYHAFKKVSESNNFMQIGADIADGVNDWLDDEGWWAETGKMLDVIVNGILDMLVGFIGKLDVGKIDKALEVLGNNIDWDGIFSKVSYVVLTAFHKALAWLISKIKPVLSYISLLFGIRVDLGDTVENLYKMHLIDVGGKDYEENVYGTLYDNEKVVRNRENIERKGNDMNGKATAAGEQIGESLANGMSDGFVTCCEKNQKMGLKVETTTGELIGTANTTIENDTSLNTTLTEKGSNGQKAFIGAFDETKTIRHFEDIWTKIQGVFSSVSDFFKSTFGDAWTKVKNIFSDHSGVENIKKSVESVFKNSLNNLISGINSVISNPIVSLNNIITKLRDFKVANLTPFSWVPTISYPQIPKLATGTYVPANYGEFLAVLGDNKREAEVVSPISAMKQAMSEVLAEYGGAGNGGDIHITLTMPDGRVLFEAVADENNKIKKRTGRSAFA